jgi:hypothetical protein
MNERLLQTTREQEGLNSMTRKPIRCEAEPCGLPAMCLLELRFYCVHHFIAHSYEGLNQCDPFPFAEQNEAAANSRDRFLQQCSDQAANLLRPARGLDNLDRARLFDILLWSSELLSKREIFRMDKVAQCASGDEFAESSED